MPPVPKTGENEYLKGDLKRRENEVVKQKGVKTFCKDWKRCCDAGRIASLQEWTAPGVSLPEPDLISTLSHNYMEFSLFLRPTQFCGLCTLLRCKEMSNLKKIKKIIDVP